VANFTITDRDGSRRLSKSGDPLHVWILSDKKPGHFNQSKGVVRALEYHFDVTTDWVNVRLRFNGHRRILTWLLNGTGIPLSPAALRWFYGFDMLPERRPDLIVSAGGNSLYANAWLARCYQCRNVFVGDIRRLNPGNFSRIITWLDERDGAPFLRWPITPVPILPEDAARAGREFRQLHCPGEERLWTLLIGGNGGGYTYHDEDWRQLATFLRDAARNHSVRWLVVTSRRTGTAAEAILGEQFDPTYVAYRSFYSAERSSSYLGCLGAAERAFCTEDSHMMVTEAISAGKPTYSLIPRLANTHWTNQRYLDAYVANGHLVRLPLSDAGRLLTATPPPLPMTDGPLPKLGAVLFDWWQYKAA